MSRVFISAAAVIVIVAAIIFFSSRGRESGSDGPVGADVAAAPGVPAAPAGAPPPMAPRGEARQAEGEIEVASELANVESIAERMAEERREAGLLPVDIDRQPLLDEIETPGEDNERVLAMRNKLRGANLEKADLRLIDLSGANAADVNLNEAKLQGADLSGANLAGAKMEGADLTAAVIDGADLRGAHMEGVTLNVRGRGVDLRSADLDGASLIGADLYQADLRNASLRDASVGAVLRNADLRFADLGRADLLDADLAGAHLEGTDLNEASNLTCEQLTQGRNWANSFRGEDLACGAAIPPTPPQAPPVPAPE